MEHISFNKDKYVFSSLPSVLLIGDSTESGITKQIALFLNELSTYNVLLKDLVNFSLNENDRNIALNISYYIMANEKLLNLIAAEKDLPVSRLSKLIKIKPEYIKKFRDYIIAYYIILSNSNYRHIQDYLKISLRENENITKIQNRKQEIYKGLVIRTLTKSAYILTSKGEFVKIKINNKTSVGELCEGRKKKTSRDFRIHIAILLVILILIGCGTVIEYRRTQSIVVIETSSTIKISINKFNKVIYAYSPTDKGKKLVDSTNVLNKDLDDALVEVFKYALSNDMLQLDKEVPTLSKKTLITINGQAIKYGSLSKTDKFTTQNNIPIIINNAGNQQKLPGYSGKDEENNSEK